MDIIIDGYNLIGAEQGLRRQLDSQRQRLVQKLKDYQALKGYNVIVVFDGWQNGGDRESSEKVGGVTVTYSRQGVKADQVVIDVARTKGAGCVVVSTDREIRRAIERFGGVAISSSEFSDVLGALDRVLVGGGDEPDWYDSNDDDGGRGGRGHLRLSKAEKKRLDKLRKLKI